MDGVTVGARQSRDAPMNATVWIELLIVVLKILSAGMAG